MFHMKKDNINLPESVTWCHPGKSSQVIFSGEIHQVEVPARQKYPHIPGFYHQVNSPGKRYLPETFT